MHVYFKEQSFIYVKAETNIMNVVLSDCQSDYLILFTGK